MKVIYTGPARAGITIQVTLKKDAPNEDSFPLPEGICLRRGKTVGSVLPWNEVVLHLRTLLASSTAAQNDVAQMLRDVRGRGTA